MTLQKQVYYCVLLHNTQPCGKVTDTPLASDCMSARFSPMFSQMSSQNPSNPPHQGFIEYLHSLGLVQYEAKYAKTASWPEYLINVRTKKIPLIAVK